MPITLAFGRQQQEDHVIELILLHIPNLRPAWATQDFILGRLSPQTAQDDFFPENSALCF